MCEVEKKEKRLNRFFKEHGGGRDADRKRQKRGESEGEKERKSCLL